MAKEKTEVRKKNKKMLTLFIMMIPALLLALTSAIAGAIPRIAFQLLLLLFEYVLIKNLLDDYYGE